MKLTPLLSLRASIARQLEELDTQIESIRHDSIVAIMEGNNREQAIYFNSLKKDEKVATQREE